MARRAEELRKRVEEPGEAALAGRYARWRATALGSITERREIELVLALSGSVSGKRVLDAGCGDGAFAIAAAERGARVTGVDLSDAMLGAARARAAARNASVDLVRGDIGALPFPQGAFDLVLAVTVLCSREDPLAVLRELARVLAPRGRLVLGDLSPLSIWAAVRRLEGLAGSRDWTRTRFRTANELAGLIRAAGLEVERVEGAIYYPPFGLAARVLGPVDARVGRLTTIGAAFVAVAAIGRDGLDPAGVRG